MGGSAAVPTGRRYCEPVEVRCRDGVPAEFLRGGRLSVVRTVLASWREAGSWWSSAAVTALLAGEQAGPMLDVADPERDVWRVEAGSARRTGVYDLCRDTDSGRWTLIRVGD